MNLGLFFCLLPLLGLRRQCLSYRVIINVQVVGVFFFFFSLSRLVTLGGNCAGVDLGRARLFGVNGYVSLMEGVLSEGRRGCSKNEMVTRGKTIKNQESHLMSCSRFAHGRGDPALFPSVTVNLSKQLVATKGKTKKVDRLSRFGWLVPCAPITCFSCLSTGFPGLPARNSARGVHQDPDIDISPPHPQKITPSG